MNIKPKTPSESYTEQVHMVNGADLTTLMTLAGAAAKP